MHESQRVWSSLTPEQLSALEAIQIFWEERATGPTLRELAPRLGISAVSGVRYRLIQLEKLGMIQIEYTPVRRVARTLRLTAAGSHALERFKQLRRSTILRGKRELFLDAPALSAARRAGVPLKAYPGRKQGEALLVEFTSRAERDFWAGLVLDELDSADARDPTKRGLISKSQH